VCVRSRIVVVVVVYIVYSSNLARALNALDNLKGVHG
jgi:hypothetical protein